MFKYLYPSLALQEHVDDRNGVAIPESGVYVFGPSTAQKKSRQLLECKKTRDVSRIE